MNKCKHSNTTIDDYGSSTCLDCCAYFEKSLTHGFAVQSACAHSLAGTQSNFFKTLEKYGVLDKTVVKLTEEIFKHASNNKMVKGSNKLALLSASLYYTYHYLGRPKTLEEILHIFKIKYKLGSKGLKVCQIALQERPLLGISGHVYEFTSSHTETLKHLLGRYEIPFKYYDVIESIVKKAHICKNKVLSDKMNSLWVSSIFFWLINSSKNIEYFGGKAAYVAPEEYEDFVTINSDLITLEQLKTDLSFFNKINLSTTFKPKQE